AVSSPPVPFLMARWMLSDGRLALRHFSTTMRKRGFRSGSPPPSRAAMVSSRESFAKARARLASMATLKCLTFAHLLCPAIKLDRIGLSSFTSRTLDYHLHKHRRSVAQYLGNPRRNLRRIIPNPDHRVGARFARLRQHLPKCVVARPFTKRRVKRYVPAEQALDARAYV